MNKRNYISNVLVLVICDSVKNQNWNKGTITDKTQTFPFYCYWTSRNKDCKLWAGDKILGSEQVWMLWITTAESCCVWVWVVILSWLLCNNCVSKYSLSCHLCLTKHPASMKSRFLRFKVDLARCSILLIIWKHLQTRKWILSWGKTPQCYLGPRFSQKGGFLFFFQCLLLSCGFFWWVHLPLCGLSDCKAFLHRNNINIYIVAYIRNLFYSKTSFTICK